MVSRILHKVVRRKRALQKFLWELLFGPSVLEFPTFGLVLEDFITKELDLNGFVRGNSSEIRDGSVYVPCFKALISPNAVDTTNRTAEEVTNRVLHRDRKIFLLVHKPRTDVSKIIQGCTEPVICFNDIVKSLTPKGYFSKYKRLYVRVEEDIIRAALENGYSPMVVRYGGTEVTRARYLRLAREYYGVVVHVLVAPDPEPYVPTKFERNVLASWKIPDVSEGFEVSWLS